MLLHSLKLKAGIALALTLTAIAVIAPGSAYAQCGGGGLSPAEIDICTPTQKAKLLPNGMLVPPKSAPARVKAVIGAANKIRSKPYVYGGGHARWWDSGYDCSGSVSYVLHAAGLLNRALDSTGFMGYGERGRGTWVTIRSNPSHAYMIVAGLRFDTSARRQTGNRWSEQMRSASGYRGRHPEGL